MIQGCSEKCSMVEAQFQEFPKFRKLKFYNKKGKGKADLKFWPQKYYRSKFKMQTFVAIAWQ